MKMRRYIRWFAEIRENEINSVGSKAMILARMTQSGYLIPSGFCINVEAYKDFIREADIEKAILTFAKELNSNDFPRFSRNIKKIKDLILSARVTKNIISEVDNAYKELQDKCGEKIRVAVRSSSSMEDMSAASFAGQYTTFLNISGFESLIQYIKYCWTSLWSEKVIQYCQKNGFNHTEVYMAVIVQRMVPSDISGVMFTINPITQSRDELLINANWGLGDAVVSGEVTPDNYIVSKSNMLIIKRYLGEKRLMKVCLDSIEGGIVEIKSDQEKQNKFALDDEQILRLAKLGQSVENYFDGPQDIEWAFMGNNLYVLQSRPITGLKTEEELEKFEIIWGNDADKNMSWDRKYIDERFPYPLTPMWGKITSLTLSDAVPYAIKKLGIPVKFPIRYRTFNGYLYGITQRKNIDFRILFTFFRILRYINKIDRDWEKITSKFVHRRNSLEEFDLKQATVAELIVHFKNTFKLWSDYFRYEILTGFLCITIIPNFFLKVTFLLTGKKDDLLFRELFAGFDNKTIAINKKLYTLLNDIKASDYLLMLFSHEQVKKIFNELSKSKEARGFYERFNKFLEEEGDRAGFEDGIEPDWKENPTLLLALLQGYLRQDIKDIGDCQKERSRERQECIRIIREELSVSIIDRIFPIKRLIFDKSLSLAQRYASIPEDSDYYIYKNRSLIKKTLLELGRRFVNRKLFNEVNDIFFLSLDELYKFSQNIERKDFIQENIGKVIEERRKMWERQFKMIPPFIIAGEGKKEEEVKTDICLEENRLRGFVGSRGRVTGKARVILYLRDSYKFRASEILVVPTTTPAWTPLFAMASGLVTDIGGVLSHGAIVAREYNIPAVVGTKIATRLIKNGTLITVDGDQGIVYLPEK